MISRDYEPYQHQRLKIQAKPHSQTWALAGTIEFPDRFYFLAMPITGQHLNNPSGMAPNPYTPSPGDLALIHQALLNDSAAISDLEVLPL